MEDMHMWRMNSNFRDSFTFGCLKKMKMCRFSFVLFFFFKFCACLSGLRSHLVDICLLSTSAKCPTSLLLFGYVHRVITRWVYGIWNIAIFCPCYLPLLSNQLLYVPE